MKGEIGDASVWDVAYWPVWGLACSDLRVRSTEEWLAKM